MGVDRLQGGVDECLAAELDPVKLVRDEKWGEENIEETGTRVFFLLLDHHHRSAKRVSISVLSVLGSVAGSTVKSTRMVAWAGYGPFDHGDERRSIGRID
jgi:hypothetical protein